MSSDFTFRMLEMNIPLYKAYIFFVHFILIIHYYFIIFQLLISNFFVLNPLDIHYFLN